MNVYIATRKGIRVVAKSECHVHMTVMHTCYIAI